MRFKPVEERIPLFIMPFILSAAFQQKAQNLHRFTVTFILEHNRKLNLVIIQRLRKQDDVLVLLFLGERVLDKDTSFLVLFFVFVDYSICNAKLKRRSFLMRCRIRQQVDDCFIYSSLYFINITRYVALIILQNQ